MVQQWRKFLVGYTYVRKNLLRTYLQYLCTHVWSGMIDRSGEVVPWQLRPMPLWNLQKNWEPLRPSSASCRPHQWNFSLANPTSQRTSESCKICTFTVESSSFNFSYCVALPLKWHNLNSFGIADQLGHLACDSMSVRQKQQSAPSAPPIVH